MTTEMPLSYGGLLTKGARCGLFALLCLLLVGGARALAGTKSLGSDPETGTLFSLRFFDENSDPCSTGADEVVARVPESVDIQTADWAQVADRAGHRFIERCRTWRAGMIQISVYHPGFRSGEKPTFRITLVANEGRALFQSPQQPYREEQQQLARVKREQEETARRALAEHEQQERMAREEQEEQDRQRQVVLEAMGARNKRLAQIREFQQQHPSAKHVTVEALFANPYAFIGRSLMVKCGFVKALDPTTLLFESLREGSIEMVVVDASSSIAEQFTKPHLVVVLALRVAGVRALQYGGGEVNFPHGTLLGVLSGEAVKDWETAERMEAQ